MYSAAFNLQQTLIATTTLILVGLAVAFAFRCGLFNIGGQGQYLTGAIFAVWIGSSFEGLSPVLHVLLALVVGTATGAFDRRYRGLPEGRRRRARGDHDDHAQLDGHLRRHVPVRPSAGHCRTTHPDRSQCRISNDIVEGAKLHVWWGDPLLQGLHIGFFIAIGALVVYWIILNRTTLGYGVKAVGFNPEAARYGGISVARNYFLAMAISGAFAGLAGAIDILGYQFRLSTGDVEITSGVAFAGIAVALLGRNTAIGVGLAALLFGALRPARRPATSTRRSSSPSSRRT